MRILYLLLWVAGSSVLSATALGQACGDPDAGDCCAANGTPACDDLACCQSVCALDPFCCDSNWDNICAGQAKADPNCSCGPPAEACCFPNASCQDLTPPNCNGAGGESQGPGTTCATTMCAPCGDPQAGVCCEPNGTPGCEEQDCCVAVCANDGFCCTTEWDQLCANAALANPICCNKNVCEWDLNGDNIVGPGDLAVLLGNWNSPYGPPELAMLLGNWGPCP